MLYNPYIKLFSSMMQGTVIDDGPELAVGQVWINEFCSVVTIDKFNPSTEEFSGTHHNMGWVAEGYFVFTGYKNLIGNTIGWTLVFQNDEENVVEWHHGQGRFSTSPVVLQSL